MARPRLLTAGLPHAVIDALERQVIGAEPAELGAEDGKTLARLSWRGRCDAWDLAEVDEVLRQERDYPRLSRILPTKLGNVMHATEDSLRNAGDDVEGFALRRRGTVSSRVQQQHDQFRTRLDMYCTLVFVSAVLAAAAVILLWDRLAVVHTAVLAGGFVLLAATSYRAAIASARGYGTAMRRMDRGSQ